MVHSGSGVGAGFKSGSAGTQNIWQPGSSQFPNAPFLLKWKDVPVWDWAGWVVVA